VRLVLASHNRHKVAEFRAIRPDIDWVSLGDLGVEDEPPEDADTFDGNAAMKASWSWARTGLPSLADDSGLEVDALGGLPGVRSRRFHPDATAASNNRLLLERLAGVSRRTARFRCVLALADERGVATVEGRCEGVIGLAPAGSGGFGYDPLFIADGGQGRSFGELPADVKNALSHRAKALLRLGDLLVP
jgi:XTP/dITP diphosphohydrolase